MDILPLLEELQLIARNGLAFAQDPYDRERYERLLGLASRYYGTALDLPPDEVRRRFAAELGYVTPKVGANAAIFDAAGRILLIRRMDDGLWCLPCGWLEPNESPEEGAVRETWEETGLRVAVERLVGVYTRRPADGFGPHTAVGILYLCAVVDGAPTPRQECTEARYWPIPEVPGWHEQHATFARDARAAWQGRSGTTS